MTAFLATSPTSLPVHMRPRLIGALPLVYPILTALQVRQIVNEVVPNQAEVDVGQLVVLLTLNRLLAQRPLSRVSEWLAETVLPDVLRVAPDQIYDTRLGRGLDRIAPQLGELWTRLVCRAVQVYGLDLTVLHWDVTSLYFEGDYTASDLARYGYSRDERPDTKQVNVEVDVTHDGAVPVHYQVLAGNTADITRPRSHLQTLLHFLARPELAAYGFHPLLVSDGKMITPEAVVGCHRAQVFYLGPLADSTATDAVLRSVSAEELAAQPLTYRPQRATRREDEFVPYQGVWRPFPFEFAGEQVLDRVLVVWSAGKQRLDVQKRKRHLKRLLTALADLQAKLNTRRHKQRAYVEPRLAAVQQGNPAKDWVDITLTGTDGALTLTFCINRQRLAQAQAVDGRYALATNAAHLDAAAALTFFKGQDKVEKRFGTVKGPLRVHPLFVHTDRRIEATVFLTLLALLVRAILEQLARQVGLARTAEQLCRPLAALQAIDLDGADHRRLRQVADLTDAQQHLLQVLGWTNLDAYVQLPPHPR